MSQLPSGQISALADDLVSPSYADNLCCHRPTSNGNRGSFPNVRQPLH